jgi:hypothetical protein
VTTALAAPRTPRSATPRSGTPRSATPRSGTPDALCAAAVEVARTAAIEVGGSTVAEPVGLVVDGDRLVTHLFASTERAYVGWRWAVTVTRAARAKIVTVDEVALLPGPEAVLPPAWVPWSERLRPGDLGVGDLLPTEADDDRLVPAYAAGDDPDLDDLAWELGLGRIRVLSLLGRDEAVQRWYDGESGPAAKIAKAAPARCSTCGFLTPVAGAMRQVFGVCANEYAPDDGRVVALDHGCGAHSEALVISSTPVPAAPVVDELAVAESAEPAVEAAAGTPAAEALAAEGPAISVGSVADAEPAEPLGHS